jgi:hypothetical protein
MKLAQKNGVIVIDAMPAEMQPALRIFDMLGDGQVAPMELARGAELYQLSKDKAKLMGRIAMVLSVVLVALVVAIGFMTAFVVEQSKETNTGVDGITKVAGGTQIAAAASVEQQDGFAAAFDWKPQQLDRVKSLYFPEDPTVTCATDVCACRVHNPSRIEYLSAYCVRNPRSHFSSQRHAITTRLVVLEH